mmetsp:Transcript_26685/g.59694  ORF Transcript_26685/g.59694 Transcript_26685/m.59694 type:complete len:232 (+) Transcript_26685:946-1641(+)
MRAVRNGDFGALIGWSRRSASRPPAGARPAWLVTALLARDALPAWGGRGGRGFGGNFTVRQPPSAVGFARGADPFGCGALEPRPHFSPPPRHLRSEVRPTSRQGRCQDFRQNRGESQGPGRPTWLSRGFSRLGGARAARGERGSAALSAQHDGPRPKVRARPIRRKQPRPPEAMDACSQGRRSGGGFRGVCSEESARLGVCSRPIRSHEQRRRKRRGETKLETGTKSGYSD